MQKHMLKVRRKQKQRQPRKDARKNRKKTETPKEKTIEETYTVQENSTRSRCLVCGETNEEDWIQCSKCCGWIHKACTNVYIFNIS